jgi:GT2 family glycosyltransferase
MSGAALTIGVTTRNRPDSLVRCLSSLAEIADIVGEVIVVDDSSEPPASRALDRVPPQVRQMVRVVEQTGHAGYIVGRNTTMRLAANEHVLLMDDDAYVKDGDALRRALAVLQLHDDVAAVACAQAEADGSPWPAAMQASRSSRACVVTAYIGFAHLLRRSVFLALGGYRELFHFNGEEKDFCMRLLDAGYRVVYLPESRVAHVPDPSGRSDARYLRYSVRNDCLSALYNEPLPLPLVSVPLRLRRYAIMRRHHKVEDPGGFGWILRELAASVPRIWRERSPVRWATLRRWRQLRLAPAPFEMRP